MHGFQKANLLEKIMERRKFKTFGFGDSPADKYFVDLCHYGEIKKFS